MQEDVNFLLTNRIPRRLATRFMGWFAGIEHPLVRDLSIRAWRVFSDLDLSDAKTTRFASLRACFVRELRDGARPIDADPLVVVSPCDAIVGACGVIEHGMALQAKGFPYALSDLLRDDAAVATYRGGRYVTLRLTAGMYHRFHAPHDCVVKRVTYLSGDVWNVNPIALKRVQALFCKNERAAVALRLDHGGWPLTLVPVAAILVASIRFNFLDAVRDERHVGPKITDCDARFEKGAEMGWFEHGSTIIALAPAGVSLHASVVEGRRIRMGEALMRLPSAKPSSS